MIPLAEAGDQPLSQVGGKGRALGQLMAFGAPVPPGFVITPDADIEATSEQILTAFDALNAQFVAVRSSAAGEDSEGQSWAGQFESYLYVTRAGLLGRIADCRASGASARAQAYDATQDAMSVAVVVQAMVAADAAGVLFTANPVTGNRDEIMIEAVYGLGEQLVQGLATPDNYVLDKSTGSATGETIAVKTARLVGSAAGLAEKPVPAQLQNRPALSSKQRAELAALATELEAKFHHPLDIEWAYADGKLYIVQARPITTLSENPA